MHLINTAMAPEKEEAHSLVHVQKGGYKKPYVWMDAMQPCMCVFVSRVLTRDIGFGPPCTNDNKWGKIDRPVHVFMYVCMCVWHRCRLASFVNSKPYEKDVNRSDRSAQCLAGPLCHPSFLLALALLLPLFGCGLFFLLRLALGRGGRHSLALALALLLLLLSLAESLLFLDLLCDHLLHVLCCGLLGGRCWGLLGGGLLLGLLLWLGRLLLLGDQVLFDVVTQLLGGVRVARVTDV
mmetsp:Transcript_16346/g.46520  ORF Transcript_16346/g.46520 Transcript_16346/m.46520 type:complete len:237 (+) Transcript_16346:504-1214(+)